MEKLKVMAELSNELNIAKYFEELRQTIKFKKWFFGHYHENKNVTAEEILIYEQIIRIN